MVLSAACSDGSVMLIPVLDQMLNGLHNQVNHLITITNLVKILRISDFKYLNVLSVDLY